MEGMVLLTHIVPGGAKGEKRHLWGEPLALGVAQGLLGALQAALGATLLVALGDPLGALLGAPLGTGSLLLVSGSLLVAFAKDPPWGGIHQSPPRHGVAGAGGRGCRGLGAAAAAGGLLLPHGCPACLRLRPAAEGVVLGAHVLLMTSSAGGVALTVAGAVAAGRGGASRGGAPIVIYQTALPNAGAGLAEATPPAPPAPIKAARP
ncbi:uncharacterized protein LOC141737084, partial [Larus michahellis]|uniref:uncharacterized protein LOC141737084 n=1 Tax=Larus michahellis TaxID=119627 RepID=UPI003D9B3414